MADSSTTSVFFVGAALSEHQDLDARLRSSGMSVEYFEAPRPCRDALDERLCHLLVIGLNGHTTDGLALLRDLEPPVALIPKLAIVDHGDIPTAVEAIRAGAVNCLEKPLAESQLFAEIQTLLHQAEHDDSCYPRSLTKMETTVLRLILKGKTTLEVARELHRSPRTIEVHRSHIMHKLDVSNPVELLKTAATMGLLDD